MRYTGQVPGRLDHLSIAQADMVDTMLGKLDVGKVLLYQALCAQC